MLGPLIRAGLVMEKKIEGFLIDVHELLHKRLRVEGNPRDGSV